MNDQISIILPAKNEARALETFLPKLRQLYPDEQILVVNDGSIDDTKEVCLANSVEVVSHAYSIGNGAAIKSGVRAAKGNILVFMDADGQHNPEDIERLLNQLNQGFDMVVGARSVSSQASLWRLCANRTLCKKRRRLIIL